MEKTAKITRTVFKNEWANPKGGSIYYHDLELDNGDKGSIGSKEKEPAKLNPGQEITYTIETTDKGIKIKLVNPQQQNNFQGGGKKSYSPSDPRISNTGYAMRYVVDLIIAGKVEYKDIEPSFEKVFGLLDKKYLELKGDKSEPVKEETNLPSEPVTEGQISHVKKIVEEGNLFSKEERASAIAKVKTLTRGKAGSFITKLITASEDRKHSLVEENDLPF
ncbi:MAG TPA: hypothetical protein VFF27_00030 [Bacteroidia bacterium]|jgi:hypothetical protein|nr:hypothetical protein [Bacteroidia bacterium]